MRSGEFALPAAEALAQFREVDARGPHAREQLRLLVALCWELQAHAGDRPWPLACRAAHRLLGVSHTTAADWLFLLVQDGVLELVTAGSQAGLKASEYRVRDPATP